MNDLVLSIKLFDKSVQRLSYDFFEGLTGDFLALLFSDFSQNFLKIGLKRRNFYGWSVKFSLSLTDYLVRWSNICTFFDFGGQTRVVCK